ncbi:MAG: heavy-metal-associated domain-containing protein [Balneolaceae bacterium]|nr:heavy-metal-associated domain-containing protein [Balneolaceae bacterium]
MSIGKTFAILFILQTFFIACSGNNSQNNQTSLNEGKVKSVEITIEGMSCMSCVANVKKTLSNMDGVKEVNVSLKDKNAQVKYDALIVTEEQLIDAINKLGYKAGKPKKLVE